MNKTADSVPGLFAALAATWQALRKDFGASYRPERHYMRGPGPKWRARNGLAV